MMAKEKLARFVDAAAYVLSPAWSNARAWARQTARFDRRGYEVLENLRENVSKSLQSGGADQVLDEQTLANLRDIARWYSSNDALFIKLLDLETDFVVGSDLTVKAWAHTPDGEPDEEWNKAHDRLWDREMMQRPCDVSGLMNFPELCWTAFHSALRDGDSILLRTDDGPQLLEGECLGTPLGKEDPKTYQIVNGVAKTATGAVIGYYIGTPNKWGYIDRGGWRNVPAERVCHLRCARRASMTRGEPILTPSMPIINKVHKEIDAELWRSINAAMLSVIITSKGTAPILPTSTTGQFPTGRTDAGTPVKKLENGGILTMPEGQATVVGSNIPSATWHQFIIDMLMFIGQPLCLPLAYITGDFSGATYMNTRIAMTVAQPSWRRLQAFRVKQQAAALHRWWLEGAIASGRLPDHPDRDSIEIVCQTWPSADRKMDAEADEIELGNNTISHGEIAQRRGTDYGEVCAQDAEDRKVEVKYGVTRAAPRPRPAERTPTDGNTK